MAIALASLMGCDLVTAGGPQLPDGDYRLRLMGQRIDRPLLTPDWMLYFVVLDFTRDGDVVTVSASEGGIVEEGPVQRFEALPEGWLMEFSLAGEEDGSRYWSVEINEEDCTMAQAVDADRLVTDDGLIVPFTACFIYAR